MWLCPVSTSQLPTLGVEHYDTVFAFPSGLLSTTTAVES